MAEKICERNIFVSSSIVNFEEIRTALWKRFQEDFGYVRFHAIFSEHSESLRLSGDDLQARIGDDPNLFILNQVKYADYFLLILNDKRYGKRNIFDKEAGKGLDKVISVTHAEFRTALRKAQPMFLFIERGTYIRYLIHCIFTLNGRICWRADEAWYVYRFIREIEKYRYGLNRTINVYTSPQDLIRKIDRIFRTYDKSKYICSDGDTEICASGEEFWTEWIVVNDGCTVWKDRYFKECHSNFIRFLIETAKEFLRNRDHASLRQRVWNCMRKMLLYVAVFFRKSTAEKTCYPIQETYPGERARLLVKYKAPEKPGKVVSAWRMVDAKGRPVYKQLVPLELEYIVEGKRRNNG